MQMIDSHNEVNSNPVEIGDSNYASFSQRKRSVNLYSRNQLQKNLSVHDNSVRVKIPHNFQFQMNTASRKSSEFPSAPDVSALNSKVDAEMLGLDMHRIGIFPMYQKVDPNIPLDDQLLDR